MIRLWSYTPTLKIGQPLLQELNRGPGIPHIKTLMNIEHATSITHLVLLMQERTGAFLVILCAS